MKDDFWNQPERSKWALELHEELKDLRERLNMFIQLADVKKNASPMEYFIARLEEAI